MLWWPWLATSQLAPMVTMAPESNSRMPWIVVGVPTLIFLPFIGTFGVVTVALFARHAGEGGDALDRADAGG